MVVGLAADYSWAVVGDPGRQSGYVLSRTRTLSRAGTRATRAVLTVTVQAGGAAATRPYC